MKKLIAILILTLLSSIAYAQKFDYGSGVISTDGRDIAKVAKIKDKENFGLTSTFELYAMSGEKLVIATIATDFTPSRLDNSSYYYRLSFLTTNQVGIFSLSKLGTEKAFAKLIGENHIISGDQLDPKMVAELLASKNRNPPIRIEYHLVSRERGFPISLKEENLILQGNTPIGKFRDVSSANGMDSYEFTLPEGLVVAKVSFRGGNNAKQFIISTARDKLTLSYIIESDKTYGSVYSSVDRNEPTLLRLVAWLVKRDYL